jgi:hypothetical protein
MYIYTIAATKAKNTLLLRVDDLLVQHGEGKAGSSSTDTKNPLYIGGVPGMLSV